MTRDVIAIIPARSGSVGVKGKNIVPLGGHPLIAYSIAVAKLMHVKRILVSTDSEEYATIARRYGAEIPFLRPTDISQESSTDFEFMRHAMEWLKQYEGSVPEYWLHLRPTTPLRIPEVLEDALSMIQRYPEATSLRSGHEAPESPFKWFLKDKSGFFMGLRDDLTPEKVNLPRQVYPTVYTPDGYVDIVRSSYVLNHSELHGSKMLVHESPQCTEIDTKADLEYVEYQLQRDGSRLQKHLNQSD